MRPPIAPVLTLLGTDLQAVARRDRARQVLADAELRGANLTHAVFYKADLTRAWLHGADLIGAGLERVDLTGA